ncbi:MAG: hypothetical protein WC707_04700 [Candidatus Babeliaceae bacterium]|jgi:hypothetical protein
MVSSEIQPLLEKLQSICNRTVAVTNLKIFFNLLYEFTNAIFSNTHLHSALESILTVGDQDLSFLGKLEHNALIVLDKAYVKIKKYITKRASVNSDITDALGQYENPEILGLGLALGRFCMLRKILSLLAKEAIHRVFVGKYAVIDEDGKIQKLFFEASVNEWESAQWKIQKKQEISDWNSARKLRTFYEGIDSEAYRAAILDRSKKDPSIKELQELYEKLVLLELEDYGQLFNIDEYKQHVPRTMEAIKQYFSYLGINKPSSIKKLWWKKVNGDLIFKLYEDGDDKDGLIFGKYSHAEKLASQLLNKKTISYQNAYTCIKGEKEYELDGKQMRLIDHTIKYINKAFNARFKLGRVIQQKQKDNNIFCNPRIIFTQIK